MSVSDNLISSSFHFVTEQPFSSAHQFSTDFTPRRNDPDVNSISYTNANNPNNDNQVYPLLDAATYYGPNYHYQGPDEYYPQFDSNQPQAYNYNYGTADRSSLHEPGMTVEEALYVLGKNLIGRNVTDRIFPVAKQLAVGFNQGFSQQ